MMRRYRPGQASSADQLRRRLLARAAPISVLVLAGVASTTVVRANPEPESIQGVPQQIVPQEPEVGLGNFSIQTGSGVFGGGRSGSGSGGSGSTGTSGGGQTSSDALDTMLDQSWGAAAQQAAQGAGLNASALAATCVLESGCQNVSGSSGAQGVFQMYPAAYQEGLSTALAADPSLASEIVQGSAGMNDPLTESIAASGYLLQANQALQNDGVSNPTVLDARGYYEFGPTYGAQVAQSPPTALLSNILPASFLSNSNISPSTTVAQWQSSVAAKIGNAATQPIVA